MFVTSKAVHVGKHESEDWNDHRNLDKLYFADFIQQFVYFFCKNIQINIQIFFSYIYKNEMIYLR